MGRIYNWEAERRKQFLLRLGIALSVAFVVLRAINAYGDPNPWSVQKLAAFTVLAFLNTVVAMLFFTQLLPSHAV